MAGTKCNTCMPSAIASDNLAQVSCAWCTPRMHMQGTVELKKGCISKFGALPAGQHWHSCWPGGPEGPGSASSLCCCPPGSVCWLAGAAGWQAG